MAYNDVAFSLTLSHQATCWHDSRKMGVEQGESLNWDQNLLNWHDLARSTMVLGLTCCHEGQLGRTWLPWSWYFACWRRWWLTRWAVIASTCRCAWQVTPNWATGGWKLQGRWGVWKDGSKPCLHPNVTPDTAPVGPCLWFLVCPVRCLLGAPLHLIFFFSFLFFFGYQSTICGLFCSRNAESLVTLALGLVSLGCHNRAPQPSDSNHSDLSPPGSGA